MGGNYADLQQKVDAWTSRAVEAVQRRDVIEQDFAINIAKGYQMKLDKLVEDAYVQYEEEPCQIDVLV